MQIKQVALLGAGAVGVLPAAKLAAAGVPLQVIASGERLSRYRSQGIYFNDRKLPLEFVSPAEAAPADLVIVATKTVTLNSALPQLYQAVSENTVILPLLNGISAKEEIEKFFPRSEVLYGLFIGHASGRDGNRICHDGVGKICFGRAENYTLSPGTAAAAELFAACGIEYEVPQDMLHTLWQKFVINVGINQTQAYFMADYGAVQRSAELQEFARNLMSEAVMIAEKKGIAGCENMIANAMELIMSIPPEAKTSMLQDMISGRATEVAAFAGTVAALGAECGVATPFNHKILQKLG